MREPVRTILLWQIFATMCRRCAAGREPELDAIVEFRIRRPGHGGVDPYRLAIADGRCTRARRAGRPPTVALEMDGVSFLRLVGGAAAPAVLLLGGRLKVRGDVLLGARLPALLNIPSARGRRPRR